LTVSEVLPLTDPEAAVIVTVPRFPADASPLTVIDATLFFEELQVTVSVMFCVVPSENVPVAVNCCTVPSGMDAFTGVTAIETRVALVTVRMALELMLPEDAVIVELPAANPIASPGTPFTFMLATERFVEVHCTDPVTFCMLPSVKVPIAVNCRVVLCAIDALVGETASETKTGAVTVTAALPLMPEYAAVIVVEPSVLLVTMPLLDTPAALVFDEFQVEELVTSLVLPSVKVPVAANCNVVPSARDALAGETATEVRTGAVTVRVAVPLTAAREATIVVEPCPLLVAMPPLEMVATLASIELQVTELVRSLVLLSLYLPVAVNCWLSPAAIEGPTGPTWIDCKTACGLPGVELPPQPASRPKHRIAIEICKFFINRFSSFVYFGDCSRATFLTSTGGGN
jgi:hypothetical protein